MAIVHVLQIYSCLVHSDVVKESTFYTDDEVSKLFVSKSCQYVFAASSKSSPRVCGSVFLLFLSNRAGKYRARLQKDAHHLFRCCTKC